MRPRFLFVPGHRIGVERMPPWPGSGRESAEGFEGTPWVAWRLLGSNHRELARSAGVFSDFDRCIASVQRLQRALGTASGVTTLECVGGFWSWALTLDRGVGAVASRFYRRQRDCEQSCRVFVVAGQVAKVAGAPLISGLKQPLSGDVVTAE